MNRRPGVTLLEVLVAIFIMAIGMLALMTLFPIGALAMQRAMRDDRCTNAAGAAAALANAWRVRETVTPTLFDTPASSGFQPADLSTAGPSYTGPSYPIYIDPFGMITSTTLPVGAVSGGTPGIVRQTVPYVGSSSDLATRWFSVLDDMVFEPRGVPEQPVAGALNRTTRYTWAYLLKRPRWSTTNEVNLWVVVYYNRTAASSETVYDATYINDNTLSITWSGAKPTLRRNSWILDVTFDANNLVHADFYPVTSATDAGPNTIVVEVVPPLKFNNIARVAVMEDVAQVFFKGNGN